ncbi:Spy/CpxP family protein refolding chaperone [Ancylomarina euxinus]|nr:periplasmic heavy metal sensor [Ancylomarina euxinus]MCZ4693509.1 periplasmic heavy metal sensor [Ancylomarina euxinus]MUP13736.1 periplasmic heavy metal sensor [Ancylomarina euxinus]
MKTKITVCIVMTLMFFSGIAQAQQRKRAERMQKTMIQLTDDQKEELKAAKVEFAKASLDVKNELNELKAHQRTLMSAENLNEKKVFENIDKMTALEKQLMQERVNMRLATSGLLDEDQQIHRNMRSDCSNMRTPQMKGRRGQMQKGDKRCFDEGRNQRGVNSFCALGLSETQKEQMKKLKLEHKKATQNLREEMQELRLKQKHLFTDEKPNKNEIFSNLDRISSIQNQLAKERVKSQKEIRNILDKDELVLFLSRPHKINENGKARMHRAF